MVRCDVGELDGREVGDAVRIDVVSRIAQLVEKLLFDDVGMHAAAGAGMLGDDESAVGMGFDDRGSRCCRGPEDSASRPDNCLPCTACRIR